MARLAAWLQEQLARRKLTRQAEAVHVGVSGATLGEILNRSHLPCLDTPIGLAGRLGTLREEIRRLAGRLPAGVRLGLCAWLCSWRQRRCRVFWHLGPTMRPPNL